MRNESPLSNRLLKQYGEEKFQWAKGGRTLTMRDCLTRLPDEIQSITQITNAVSEVVQQGSGKR